MKATTRRAVLAGAALLLSAHSGLCQIKDTASALNTFGSTIRSTFDPLCTVVSYILGLAGAVMVVPTVMKHNKGDHTSADAFMKLASGMLMGFIILQGIKLIFF